MSQQVENPNTVTPCGRVSSRPFLPSASEVIQNGYFKKSRIFKVTRRSFPGELPALFMKF